MATFKAVVFTTGKHIKNDGTSNIKIRIYHNKKSQYIPTHFFIDPNYLKNGEISNESSDADIFNYEIGEIIQNYRKITIKIGSSRLMRMSCKDLKKYIVEVANPEYDQIDFVKFANDVIAITKKERTAEWYQTSLDVLKWYYKMESIEIIDITSSKLKLMIKDLRVSGPKGKPLEPGSISNYLRGIRALFNKAVDYFNDEDLGIIRIQHDPFKNVEIPQYRRKKKNIGIPEIKLIRDGHYDSFIEEFGRDIFMMMFYLMGINAHDLYCLKAPTAGRIEYERSKTLTDDNMNNFVLSIKVEPELQELIDKYSPDGFLSTIKNRYSDSYNMRKAVNKGLKKICEDKNLKKVTSNWARHSWASAARNKAGISKSDIDFCLGHVNHEHKMADIYIEEDYSIYDEINRKVLDLLK